MTTRVFEVNVDKLEIKGRRRARRLVLQALYQWWLANDDLVQIEAQWQNRMGDNPAESRYFTQLLRGVISQLPAIEEALLPGLDRPIASLNPIELTVLRISTYELLFAPEVPYRVVLDESVALTREFGSQDGFRYVNGVLNHLAKHIRVHEINYKSPL
jgi:N utilization substance protein B